MTQTTINPKIESISLYAKQLIDIADQNAIINKVTVDSEGKIGNEERLKHYSWLIDECIWNAIGIYNSKNPIEFAKEADYDVILTRLAETDHIRAPFYKVLMK